ncbi:quinol:cytochrome c oxidoreductase monoheme cytochrome subunit [Tenacibaculum adriaticum]|uniref:Quinol:cytochrome c oxidoreductase monoheme cytochrome subunit n=1 Tax=Tenacibaculum adriaticum TaxID=413713 RepID=A0A5S5DWI5_9FLAO|nr:cytochrome c [Tenacibaculum adriaticum]TYQ00308.1 quinol:cytochrome c oxidoreductase monoheme cytochrome subunit [Tenacibaculum adriaticum]
MKSLKIIIALVVVASFISCNNKRTPQVQYMPDMYVSIPYDANGVEAIDGKPVNRLPVAGTVSRSGVVAYDIANTNEGYEKAKAELKSPLEVTDENLAKGKELYGIYCAICHGTKGDGNGILSERDKFNGIPNYKDREVTEGSIYHVIMYGKNLMGSHASQLNHSERWQVVQYVEKLRSELK